MGLKTGRIKYNVNQRGRKFRGKDRHFDTSALAKIVNGGECQERVAKGDMLGYYGHWPRTKFGMNPQEGGIVGGKAVAIEPAVRTVFLKAYDDGTIEHETEFLETEPGKAASRLYMSKAGGFSSAIDAPKRGNVNVPSAFYGFDYVLEPNYSTNRGYVLDGVDDDEGMLFDQVDEYNAMLSTTNRIFDSMQAEYDRALATVAALEAEREELYSMLKSGGKSPKVMLDGIIDVFHGRRPDRDPDDFMAMRLAGYEAEKSEPQAAVNEAATRSFFNRRFGLGNR